VAAKGAAGWNLSSVSGDKLAEEGQWSSTGVPRGAPKLCLKQWQPKMQVSKKILPRSLFQVTETLRKDLAGVLIAGDAGQRLQLDQNVLQK